MARSRVARGCGSRGLGVSGEPSQDPAALPLLTGVPGSPSTSPRQGEGPASTAACASAPGEPAPLPRHPPSSGSTGTGRPPGAPLRQPAGQAAPGSRVTQQSCRASGSVSPGSPVRVPAGGEDAVAPLRSKDVPTAAPLRPCPRPRHPQPGRPHLGCAPGPVLRTRCPRPLGSRRGGQGSGGGQGGGLCAHRGDPCLRAAAPPTGGRRGRGGGRPEPLGGALGAGNLLPPSLGVDSSPAGRPRAADTARASWASPAPGGELLPEARRRPPSGLPGRWGLASPGGCALGRGPSELRSRRSLSGLSVPSWSGLRSRRQGPGMEAVGLPAQRGVGLGIPSRPLPLLLLVPSVSKNKRFFF